MILKKASVHKKTTVSSGNLKFVKKSSYTLVLSYKNLKIAISQQFYKEFESKIKSATIENAYHFFFIPTKL